MPSTVAPLLAAIDQELSQGLTPEDIQKIGSVFGDGSSPGVLDNPGGGLSGEDLKEILDHAGFLACGAEGETGTSPRRTATRHATANLYPHLLGKGVQLGSSGRGVY